MSERPRGLAIGGSEIAALFGVHDYLDEFALWVRKKSPLPPGDGKPSPRMLLGTFLQQGIVAYYSHITGKPTEWRDKTERHPEYPFMAYSVDAVVIGERRGVDAKYVSWDKSWRWGDTVEDIPPHCVMQAWWYMAALDYLAWDIAALVMGEDEPRIYTIERDLEVERAMLNKAEQWWQRYLVGDERPPITGGEISREWLKHTYPRHRRNDIVRAGQDQIILLDDYATVRDEFDCIDERRQLLESQIKEQIGEHEGLKWPRGQFTWKRTKDSERVDWEGLARLLVDPHPERAKLVKEFTHTKPGVRRIYFKDARGKEQEIQ